MTTITIVTPWHNQEHLTHGYLQAIRQLEDGDQLLVVDNASDPALRFAALRADTNLGFCGGSNLGLYRADTDAVLFLNNDIEPTRSSWLEEIRDQLEPGVLVGPVRDEPWTVIDGQQYPYIDGWCLAGMRDDLIALGGWDETLEEPAYYSDNLLCLAARRSGMTLRDVSVGLVHYEGQTARLKAPRDVDVIAARNRQRFIDSVRGVPAAPTR